MQTIATKYLGDTDHLGARIKATHSGAYTSVTLGYDSALSEWSLLIRLWLTPFRRSAKRSQYDTGSPQAMAERLYQLFVVSLRVGCNRAWRQ